MNKGFKGLWALLAAALLIFTVYSCFDAFKVGDVEIKSSGIADRMTREPDTVEVVSDSVALAQEVTFPVPLDTTSHNILIIGDSMLEGLNPALAAYAEQNGHKLNSVIWYASTSDYWGKCDTLNVFLKRFKPDYIFISLGGNEMFVTDIAKKRDKLVKNFLSQIGDIPYLWIGPPNWKPDTGINDLIKANVPKGCYFRSNGMVLEREKDGCHPTKAAAKIWLDSIARWMPNNARYPIKMQKPSPDIKARPENVVVLQPLK